MLLVDSPDLTSPASRGAMRFWILVPLKSRNVGESPCGSLSLSSALRDTFDDLGLSTHPSMFYLILSTKPLFCAGHIYKSSGDKGMGFFGAITVLS